MNGSSTVPIVPLRPSGGEISPNEQLTDPGFFQGRVHPQERWAGRIWPD
jgi:hypothetical protein